MVRKCDLLVRNLEAKGLVADSSGMDLDDASLRLTIDIISAVRIDCYSMLQGILAYCAIKTLSNVCKAKLQSCA